MIELLVVFLNRKLFPDQPSRLLFIGIIKIFKANQSLWGELNGVRHEIIEVVGSCVRFENVKVLSSTYVPSITNACLCYVC